MPMISAAQAVADGAARARAAAARERERDAQRLHALRVGAAAGAGAAGAGARGGRGGGDRGAHKASQFTNVKVLGTGSFGRAVLVRDAASGMQRVIKEIELARLSAKERAEAKKEAEVLGSLHHPNIVRCHGSFMRGSTLCIVMDYCQGGDLHDRLNRLKAKGMPLSEDDVLDWLVQICLALKHLHDRKILHRDIKTQNLFLTAAGVIKLGDFGVSRVLNGTHQMAHTQVGTPYYLSPEICENRPYNAKSDVWSLGCVLYELTTFRHAFDAASLKLLVLKIVRGIYTPVPATRYSKGMRDLVTAMLQKDPSKRPGINRILERPIVQRRVAKFLSPGEIEGAQAEAGAQALEGKRSPLDVRSAACVATASPESVRTNSAQRKPPLPPEARVLSAAAAAKAIALPGGGGIARPSSAGSRQAGTPTDAHAGGGVITKAPNAVAVAARRKRERECDKESRYSEALAALQRRTEERMRAEAAQRNREAEDARLRAERASRHRMLAQKSAERRAAAAAAREAKAQALAEARREMMVAGRRRNAAANAEGAVRPAEVQIFAAPMRGAGTPAASKMAAAHAAPTARTLQAGAGKRVCVGSSVQTGPPVIAIAAAAPTAAERRAAYEDIRSAAARNRAACQRDLSGQPTEIEANVGTNAAVGSSVALHAAEAMQHGAQRVEQGSNSDGESPDEVRVRRERDREAAAEARKAELAAAMRADLGEARAAARRNRCNVHADLCRWSCNQESDADDAARAIGQEGIRDAATSSEGGAAYQLKPQRAVDAGEGEVMGGVDAGEGGAQDDGCETGEEAAARAVSAARAEAEAAADLDSAEREAVLAEMRAAVLGARCPEYGRGLPDDDDDVDGSEPWTPPFPKFILGEAEVVLPNVSDDDTVSTRAEALRLYLEDTVTTQNFLEAYHIMDGLRAGDDEDDACVRVSKALGGNAEVATLIQQLIVCEDTLCNANVNDDPRGGA